MVFRVAVASLCLLSVVVIPISDQRRHTLCLWASIGATLGFGAGGLLGLGPIGLIPFGLVIAYAMLTRHELDYDATLTGAAVSGMSCILVSIPALRLP
jgi:hypothetical protein